LPKRLVNDDHHHKSISTLHVHLDQTTCLEVTVLRGGLGEVRHFADHVIAERGVRYGQLIALLSDTHKPPKDDEA
jgi:CopG family nickel-responsive transcriptional regulator